jgi:hypothetical protein
VRGLRNKNKMSNNLSELVQRQRKLKRRFSNFKIKEERERLRVRKREERERIEVEKQTERERKCNGLGPRSHD